MVYLYGLIGGVSGSWLVLGVETSMGIGRRVSDGVDEGGFDRRLWCLINTYKNWNTVALGF